LQEDGAVVELSRRILPEQGPPAYAVLARFSTAEGVLIQQMIALSCLILFFKQS
jgi:hypothetical protein